MASRSHVALLGPGRPLELPRPGRSAAPYAALTLITATLVLVPDVPRVPAAVAAAAFGLAAAARAGSEQHALRRLRATVDSLLLRDVSPPYSPLISWRCAELTSSDARERLAASIRRIERASSASSLPGASPLQRGAVRTYQAELDAIVDRLLVPDPVSARGMLLVKRLLEDPAGPLFSRDAEQELAHELRVVATALDARRGPAAR